MSTFEEKFKQSMNLIDEKIKDSSSRKLLESLKDTPDISQSKHFYSEIIYLLEINFCMYFSDETNTVLFYLLHAIFVPTSKKVTRDHNGKKKIKSNTPSKIHKTALWFLRTRFVKLRNTSLYGAMKKTLSNHLF